MVHDESCTHMHNLKLRQNSYTATTSFIKQMLIHVVDFTCTMTLCHTVWNTRGNRWQSSQNVMWFPATLFHTLTWSVLYLWSLVEKALDIDTYELRALCCNCMLATYWMSGKLFNILMWQRINWGRNLLHHKLSMLPRQNPLFSRECMKRVMYMLMVWENLGTKFL